MTPLYTNQHEYFFPLYDRWIELITATEHTLRSNPGSGYERLRYLASACDSNLGCNIAADSVWPCVQTPRHADALLRVHTLLHNFLGGGSRLWADSLEAIVPGAAFIMSFMGPWWHSLLEAQSKQRKQINSRWIQGTALHLHRWTFRCSLFTCLVVCFYSLDNFNLHVLF